MSLIIFIFASILLSIITYWMSLFAVSITVLKSDNPFKGATVIAAACGLNYLWLVLLNAVEMGKLPLYVLTHWMLTLLVVAVVAFGLRWFKQGLRETADSTQA